ncbi:LEAF RUST 10 DISEASE-RESISTANCE LOCUS RECEPTOR-LIKE PROTEIN KINASE-like 2.1 isoform X2 [Daucus carota subsp. sativus]|uniref:LEAF RUST 10 DISEASE-RESISTANCE LOCUS RECEPTOR-LIKE PROTEIN KINASE-like 2.1 isoform X2 n=1 Tax=Daucus carota subsp. sativus TaxID=79200 RepID=UPI0007EFBC7B|nr:PREDICTED: LEAF RUST 10 DISEASE-RESISTANCE LOCUS RECEPTOR-LIKE PROTEIN KINASE-like 2.1 isoform X2 [Daucus carota subsp. sativus]
MHAKLLRPRSYFPNLISNIISILCLSVFIPRHNAKVDLDMYNNCSKPTTSPCGTDLGWGVNYPFWGEDIRPSYCGLEEYELSCEENSLVVDFASDIKYNVLAINPFTITIELKPLGNPLKSICEPSSSSNQDTEHNDPVFYSRENSEVIYVFYNCSDHAQTTSIKANFSCGNDNRDPVYFFRNDSFEQAQKKLSSCNYTRLPVHMSLLEEFISDHNPAQETAEKLLVGKFEVYYNVENNQVCKECYEHDDGLCWKDTYVGSKDPCLYQSGSKKSKGLIIGAVGVLGGTILLLSVLVIFCCRKKTNYGSFLFSKNVSSFPKDVDAFIKQYGSSIPRRFRYSTIKKVTNSFKDELGKGGYGTVYRGRLSDGRVVAVKVLNATKGNGEEFINEVASIGRTSHVNVVTLLGFCYEGKRRALIYEFMPNGSLEKFIYGTNPLLDGQHLGWEKLLRIAIGIARGLEYLHRGCNTRILHFDIKPHNILLDKDFCPKISDFGLAKLYTTNESAVSSLLQARGTIGYIAPEVISRNFGQVSHKSDVYSYGMMILEMVGGRKNVNASADHTSQIYYPRWLYKRLQFDDVLNMANEISAEENELVRKMVMVGLWCIQIYPSQRPSISKVIEMLEGQTAALEIPPRPYLCSVPGSPSNSPEKPVFCSSSGTEPTLSA